MGGKCLRLRGRNDQFFSLEQTRVFHSHSRRFHGEALRFLIGFGLCYAVQFALTWALTRMMGEAEWQLPGGFVMSPYGPATLIGMGAYTICNYLYNRLVTFHQ